MKNNAQGPTPSEQKGWVGSVTCFVICHTQSINCTKMGDLSWSAWFLSPWPILWRHKAHGHKSIHSRSSYAHTNRIYKRFSLSNAINECINLPCVFYNCYITDLQQEDIYLLVQTCVQSWSILFQSTPKQRRTTFTLFHLYAHLKSVLLCVKRTSNPRRVR